MQISFLMEMPLITESFLLFSHLTPHYLDLSRILALALICLMVLARLPLQMHPQWIALWRGGGEGTEIDHVPFCLCHISFLPSCLW